MARARSIKPGFFFNVELAELNSDVRLMFIGLWCIADRAGRLKDQPPRIKAETLPYDDVDINDALNQLQSKGFIKRYEVKGCKYIQVINWDKHQNPHIKERESEIPEPGKHRTSTVLAPDKHSTSMEEASPRARVSDSGYLFTDNGYLLAGTLELKLAALLFSLILSHNSKAKEPDIEKWAEEIDRMIRIDERDPQEIEVIIRWCQDDDFWFANILSAKKLREKYDQLMAHMSRELKKSEPKGMDGLRYLAEQEGMTI